MSKLSDMDLPFSCLIIWGGFGNQLYHYAFYRWYELVRNEQLILDDSSMIFDNQHTGYTLEKAFDIPTPRLMSKMLNKSDWDRMYNAFAEGGGLQGTASIPEQFRNAGYNFALIHQRGYHINYSGIKIQVPYSYSPDDARALQGPVYFHAFLGMPSLFFSEIKDVLMNELKFRPMTDKRDIEYKNMILGSNAAALHIRRNNWGLDMFGLSEVDVYRRAMEIMDSRSKDITYFVFSDDIPWCKANEEALGLNKRPHVFIEGHSDKEGNSFRDLELMTYCAHHFTYHSSFSVWGFLLSKKEGIYLSLDDVVKK